MTKNFRYAASRRIRNANATSTTIIITIVSPLDSFASLKALSSASLPLDGPWSSIPSYGFGTGINVVVGTDVAGVGFGVILGVGLGVG